jgi:hypothetical protein
MVAASLTQASPPPAEVTEPPYLFEIVRHIYRWYLDENDVERAVASKDFTFWARGLEPTLDEGDHSRFAEIAMPLFGVSVKVKQSDYRIEETDAEIKTDNFRITNVARMDPGADRPEDAREITVAFAEMKDFLFRTRNQAQFPDEALFERLRAALRKHAGVAPEHREPGRQTAFLSPLSPVANEWWVYWENRRMLIRFTSDIDLTNPAVWDRETLSVRTFDAYSQVVVSMDEAPGSSIFMTRDQVGRALYNCLVLGRKLELDNPPAPAAETPP